MALAPFSIFTAALPLTPGFALNFFGRSSGYQLTSADFPGTNNEVNKVPRVFGTDGIKDK